MARQPLVVNTFQYPDGTPVANGYLIFRLSVDGSVNDTQIQRTFTKILLNSSGVVTGSPMFWPNSAILPAGSYYVMTVYSAVGQIVAGPNKVTI